MGLLSKLVGGGAKGAVEIAEGVANIVERWAPSEEAKAQMHADVQKLLNESLAAARQYDPRTTSDLHAAQFFNVVVDGLCRLIRPGVTVLLVGAVFGWWPVETQTVDPIVLAWGEAVVGFWFGARAITKDIPSLIKLLVDLKKGRL